MELISIEDFSRLELRVGKIVEVNDHPKGEKLYILKVDIGDEVRTLVAGIKPWYPKEELLGKYVIVLANLEPKTIRGVTSQGMLLAADDGVQVSILTIDKPIKLGSRVR